MKKQSVGIAGIGSMGRAAVEKFHEAGLEVNVFDLFESSIAKVRDLNVNVCKDPPALCAVSDVVLMFLPGPPEVSQFLKGATHDSVEGRIFIDLSTVDPESTRAMAELCITAGAAGYLDAPVLGRPDRAGKWTLPIGGETIVIEQVRDLLKVIANRLIHVGGSGNGNAVKLLNNMMFGAINTATAEIFSAAKKVGIEPAVLFDAISESGAATVSNLFLSIGPKMVTEDYSPIFRMALLHKDMALGLKMAKNAGAIMLAAEMNQKMIEIAMVKGLDNDDSSALIKVSDYLSSK